MIWDLRFRIADFVAKALKVDSGIRMWNDLKSECGRRNEVMAGGGKVRVWSRGQSA